MSDKTCKYCEEPIRANGMCDTHNRRAHRGATGKRLTAPLQVHRIGDAMVCLGGIRVPTEISNRLEARMKAEKATLSEVVRRVLADGLGIALPTP